MKVLVLFLACACVAIATIHTPDAPVLDHAGYKTTLFAHSFDGTPGQGGYAIGLAAHPDGSLYIGNYNTGTLSKWSVASTNGAESDHVVGTLMGTTSPAGMKFSTSGRLFVVNQGSSLVTEHTTTGALVGSCARGEFASGTDLQMDPISQDIFVSTLGSNLKVYRVSNFNPSISACVPTPYGAEMWRLNSVDGMAFAGDGTLYLAEFTSDSIWKLPASNAGGATAVPQRVVSGILNVDGLAISRDGRYLYGQTNWNVVRVFDLSVNSWITGTTSGTPGQVSHTPSVFSTHRGDLATVGPDGCYYGGDYGQVIKVTKADGTCDLFGQNTVCATCKQKLRTASCAQLPQPVQGC